MDSIIIYILSHIIECFIAYHYYNNLFKNASQKNPILPYLLTYSSLCIIMFLHIPFLNMISFVLLNSLLCIYTYKTTLTSGIFYSVILTVLMASTEILVEMIPNAFLYNFFSNLEINSIVIFCFISSKFLYLLAVLIFVHIKGKSKNQNNYYIPFYTISITVIVCIILCILFYISTITNMNKQAEYSIIVACTLIIVLVLVMLWLQEFIQNKQAELSMMKLALEQEKNANNYFVAIQQQSEDKNILIHDIKNHILILQELYRKNEYGKVEEYLNQLIDLPALSKSIKLTPSDTLNILLNVYVLKSEQLGISFSVDCDSNYHNFLDISHLTALFCNLLDNSVEAASKCNNPFISIIIRYDTNINQCKISISNSCNKAPIVENKKLLTSKNDTINHGIGISSVERIVNLYNGNICSYYKEITNSFNTIIIMNKEKLS